MRRNYYRPEGPDDLPRPVLELSLRESKWLRHRTIGTEHVLLGMLHTQTGRAYAVLAAYGFGLNQMQRAVADLDHVTASG